MKKKSPTEFEILVEGRFRELEIVVNYRPGQTMPSDEAIASWVEEVWQRNLAEAGSKGVPLYDGKLFRLADFRVEGSRLLLELGDTGYKEYVATRQPEFHRSHPREDLANPLAVCAAIATSDLKILVERRRGLDVYPGRYHVIGGFIERDKDNACPTKAIGREVLEEIGLDIDTRRFTCLGLVYDLATPHPELCFSAVADATFDEISRRQGTDREVGRLEFIESSPAALGDFILRNHGSISATGEPCLLLYGASRFGRAWRNRLLAEIG